MSLPHFLAPLSATVPPEKEGARLSSFLLGSMGLSAHRLSSLKVQNAILVNGSPTHVNYTLHSGDFVSLNLPKERATAVPGTGKVQVLYEDAAVLVVEKPAAIPTHPARYHETDSLASRLAAQRPELRFRPLSRLDIGTGGVVTLAKTAPAAAALHTQMRQGKVEKTYLALAVGSTPDRLCCTDYTCERTDKPSLRRVCAEGEQGAQYTCTEIVTLAKGGGLSCVAAFPRTGRTHQIRLQLAHAGFPLLGDRQYGTPSTALPHQALFAFRVRFFSPETGAPVTVQAPLPEEFALLLSAAGMPGAEVLCEQLPVPLDFSGEIC